MCTLSLIPLSAGGWRAVFNRDEQRTRLPARPPERRSCGNQIGLFPVDPSSDGTWIGINAAGLAVALLNRTLDRAHSWQRTQVSSPSISRGTVIPQLLAATTMKDAETLVQSLPVDHMPHFQLIIVCEQQYSYWTWDGQGPARLDAADITAPVHWSSSGLGDDLVREPRAQRFRALLAQSDVDLPTAQDRFHDDRSGENSATWVNMTRDDARTVSRTVLVSDHMERCTMTYTALDEFGHVETEADEQAVS